MRGASTESTQVAGARRITRRAGMSAPERSHPMTRLEVPPVTFVTRTAPDVLPQERSDTGATAPVFPAAQRWPARGLGSASVLPGLPAIPFSTPHTMPATDPDVWLIALPLPHGGVRSLEGAGRAGAIRVSRPYGHLRTIHPVGLDPLTVDPNAVAAAPKPRRSRSSAKTLGATSSATAADATDERLPAPRPTPAITAAIEVETDAGIFRVERRESVLTHSDMAWAMAHLETGEPESMVPLPRRQLALLLTLLPSPQDPEHPELDPVWGWAHKLRGPWERGPLHQRGRLGRLIAFDPDDSGRGMHRACFELLGSEEVVWAVGVPCFRTGSVYELAPLGKGLHPSRWLTWPLTKGRKKPGAPERPTWEIARVVYRVGAPRWPLAGVVEPLGPMGVAG